MAILSQKLRDEAFYDYKKSASAGLCWVRGCRNRAKSKEFSLCSKHAMRRWRSQNETRGAYAMLRDHAKARKIKFTISHEYFRGLTDAYNFYEQDKEAKKYGEYLSIDRVNASKGYEPGNLQIMSVSSNVAKGNKERFLPEHVQQMLQRRRAKKEDQLREEAEADLAPDFGPDPQTDLRPDNVPF